MLDAGSARSPKEKPQITQIDVDDIQPVPTDSSTRALRSLGRNDTEKLSFRVTPNSEFRIPNSKLGQACWNLERTSLTLATTSGAIQARKKTASAHERSP